MQKRYTFWQKSEFGFNWQKSWHPPSQEGGLYVLMELALRLAGQCPVLPAWVSAQQQHSAHGHKGVLATQPLLLQCPGHAAEQLLLAPKTGSKGGQHSPAECSEHFRDSFCRGKAGGKDNQLPPSPQPSYNSMCSITSFCIAYLSSSLLFQSWIEHDFTFSSFWE